MAWTTEQIERLKELAARNWSFSQIAEHFGDKTRNAVAGQLYRLKINISRKDYVWDGDKSALLEKLHIGAYTVEQMAEKLQTTVGAVRGKLERLRSAKRIRPRKRTFGFAAREARLTVRRDRKVIRLSDATPIMVPFMELRNGQCRYIPGTVNGSNTIYCGAPVEDGQSYCSPHCRTCFQPRR
jgi:hypothetical protein